MTNSKKTLAGHHFMAGDFGLLDSVDIKVVVTYYSLCPFILVRVFDSETVFMYVVLELFSVSKPLNLFL